VAEAHHDLGGQAHEDRDPDDEACGRERAGAYSDETDTRTVRVTASDVNMPTS